MKYLLLGILILTASFGAIGQDIPRALLVKLSVGSPDPTLQSLIRNKLRSELNAVGDIELTDGAHIYQLEVIAMEIKTARGVFVGYALSTEISRTVMCEEFMGEDGKYSPFDVAVSHRISLTDKIKMNSSVAEIVGDFNARLKPIRQAMKGLRVKVND